MTPGRAAPYRAEVDAFVGLQKSQDAARYYMNLGFGLRRIEDPTKPDPDLAHITLRADDLPGGEQIDDILDLRSPMSDEVRQEALVRALHERVDPFLEEGGSLEGLRRMLGRGAFRGAAVTLPARQLLAASDSPSSL